MGMMEMRALLRQQEAVGLTEKTGRASAQCWLVELLPHGVPSVSKNRYAVEGDSQLREAKG